MSAYPTQAVSIGGTAIKTTATRVSNALDAASATCRLSLADDQAALDLEGGPQTVVVSLGFGGSNVAAFTGTTDADQPSPWPLANEVAAVGRLAALAKGAAAGATYRSLYDAGGWASTAFSVSWVPGTGDIVVPFTDVDLANALMVKAGLSAGQYSIAGAAQALASRTPIVLGRGAGEMLRWLRRVDLLTGYWTADQASGVVTRAADPRVASSYGSALGTFAEGATGGERPILNGSLRRPRSLGAILNGQLVLGYVYADPLDPWAAAYFNRPNAAMVTSTALVSGTRWAAPVDEPLVETTAMATALCQALLRKWAKLQNSVGFEVDGDASLDVGQVWNLRLPSLGLAGSTPHLVTAIDHEWLPGRAVTRLTFEGLTGAAGSPVDAPPTADMSVTFGGTTATAHVHASAGISDPPFDLELYGDTTGTTKKGLTTDSLSIAYRTQELPGTLYALVTDRRTQLRTLLSARVGGP